MNDAAAAARTFRRAAELNLQDRYRQGSIVRLPDYGQVVMTGDLHGHAKNFQKLQRFCRLEEAPVRHVVLHELIHGEPAGPNEPDRSCQLLLAAACWKVQHPDQVHFMQANHELAQLTGRAIARAGHSVLEAFEAGVAEIYGPAAESVLQAINEFILSLPLAVRTPNRIFLVHTLPDDRYIPTFDVGIFDRPLSRADLGEGGGAYQLVSGRTRKPENIQYLAEKLQVDCFIVGHQHQEQGYALVHDRVIVLASDHNHGVFLPFDLARGYRPAELVRNVRKFVSVG
ncbi:MAG: metallophosphoesterase [Phycisphaerae bacterium]